MPNGTVQLAIARIELYDALQVHDSVVEALLVAADARQLRQRVHLRQWRDDINAAQNSRDTLPARAWEGGCGGHPPAAWKGWGGRRRCIRWNGGMHARTRRAEAFDSDVHKGARARYMGFARELVHKR